MEPGEIVRWQRRLGPGWEVIPRTRFGRRYGLAAAFRGGSRPDMVAVHNARRRVLVGDVTARPDPAHLAKTVDYARRLAAQLPPSLAGYRVLAQDWYWALPPEWGRRSWATSRRLIVAPGGQARATARIARALPELIGDGDVIPDVLLHHIFRTKTTGPREGSSYRGYDRHSDANQTLLRRALDYWGGPGPAPDIATLDLGHATALSVLRPGATTTLRAEPRSINRARGRREERSEVARRRARSTILGLDPHDPTNPHYTRTTRPRNPNTA